MVYFLFWIFIQATLGDLTLFLVNAPTSRVTFGSFTVFHGDDSVLGQKMSLVVPYIGVDCKVNLSNIVPYNRNTGNFTALLIQPKAPCYSYTKGLTNFEEIEQGLEKLHYPKVRVIAWLPIPGDLQPPGSPSSEIYCPKMVKQSNVDYIVMDDGDVLRELIDKLPPSAYSVLITNMKNPWLQLLRSSTYKYIDITLDCVKGILFLSLIGIFISAIYRRRFQGRIQLQLALVGMIQLGSDVILARLGLDKIAVSIYSLSIMLLACIINSFLVLTWYNILHRFQVKLVKGPFLNAVKFESVVLSLAILVLLILEALQYTRVGGLFPFFNLSLAFILGVIGAVPLFVACWFIVQARYFFRIFSPIARLINAQWLTLFVFFTRILFIMLLLSSSLLFYQSVSPGKFLTFSILHNASLILYNSFVILIVIQIQAIRSGPLPNPVSRSSRLPRTLDYTSTNSLQNSECDHTSADEEAKSLKNNVETVVPIKSNTFS